MSTAHAPNGSHSASVDGPRAVSPFPRPGDTRLSLPAFSLRVAVALLITLVILFIAYILWQGIHVLLQAFGGVLFAVFLAALSDWLHKHSRLSYAWSLTVVVVVLVLLSAGMGWFVWNRLATQTEEMTHKLPEAVGRLRDYLAAYPWGRQLLEQVPMQPPSLPQVSEFTRLTGLVTGVFDFLVTVVIVIFVGIFGAADPQIYREGILHLVPNAHRPRTREALNALAYNLRWWLVGQVFLMIAIGATTSLGLWVIGVPLALALGVIAGIMEMVPYLGPWLSAVPAILIALLLSPTHALAVAGLYLGLHILEGYLLLPLVQERVVQLPPAFTLIMQVLLGEVFGLMGLFVAAPLTVVIVVLFKMLYVEDTLGDQAVNVPGEPGSAPAPS